MGLWLAAEYPHNPCDDVVYYGAGPLTGFWSRFESMVSVVQQQRFLQLESLFQQQGCGRCSGGAGPPEHPLFFYCCTKISPPALLLLSTSSADRCSTDYVFHDVAVVDLCVAVCLVSVKLSSGKLIDESTDCSSIWVEFVMVVNVSDIVCPRSLFVDLRLTPSPSSNWSNVLAFSVHHNSM